MLSLDDYAWLNSSEGQAAWRLTLQGSTELSRAGIRAATRISSTHADLLLEQRLFADGKSRAKVEDPNRWFWTQRLFEQASDEWTAKETALDAPQACGRWFDVCCGAGVDCVALATRRSSVTGVDIDPIAVALARANASMNQVDIQLENSSAESIAFDRAAFFNIDPDRRNDGHRTIDPFRSQPAWPWIAQAIVHCGAVSLKLAPALRVGVEFDWCGTPRPQTMRWLSWNGSVRQQRWYWGVDRWPADTRIASCGNKRRGWHHEIFTHSGNFTGLNSVALLDEPSRLLSGYIADQDPVVRAAGVSDLLAQRLQAMCIGDRNGYFYSEHPVFHPMLRWFRVNDVVTMDPKRIRSMTRGLHASHWELKSRGVEIDLDAMRRQLHFEPTSDRRMTLLFTRMRNKHLAIVAERMEGETE